ncbi:MAG: antitoxin [SAR324 cluster bacterium]|nr:antitoxin [SAR324 cluster bacterium]
MNARFQEWLKDYVHRPETLMDYERLMSELNYARPSRHFTREEMNER